MNSASPPVAVAWPAVVWPSIKFTANFNGNPLYPSKYDLDFIVCFRFDQNNATPGLTAHTFTAGSDEKLLASSGVLHALTFWGGYNTNTVFRLNIVNQMLDASSA